MFRYCLVFFGKNSCTWILISYVLVYFSQVKNHAMLGFLCLLSLSRVLVLVMLFPCCGSSVAFLVTVHNLLRLDSSLIVVIVFPSYCCCVLWALWLEVSIQNNYLLGLVAWRNNFKTLVPTIKHCYQQSVDSGFQGGSIQAYFLKRSSFVTNCEGSLVLRFVSCCVPIMVHVSLVLTTQ